MRDQDVDFACLAEEGEELRPVSVRYGVTADEARHREPLDLTLNQEEPDQSVVDRSAWDDVDPRSPSGGLYAWERARRRARSGAGRGASGTRCRALTARQPPTPRKHRHDAHRRARRLEPGAVVGVARAGPDTRRPPARHGPPSGHDLNPVELFAAYGIANVLAVVPLTPGGLGVIDASAATLLVSFGTTSAVADLGGAGMATAQLLAPHTGRRDRLPHDPRTSPRGGRMNGPPPDWVGRPARDSEPSARRPR